MIGPVFVDERLRKGSSNSFIGMEKVESWQIRKHGLINRLFD